MKKNNFRYIKLKWVKSRNKLYALLRSDRSREILTFMFFLVISFIFWVLQSLNEDVESSFSLNVKYVNVPEKVVFTNKLPDEIDVRLRDKGTTLMGYLMERMPVIEIDFEQYKNNKGVFIVTSSQLSTLVRKQLKNTTTLLSVSPDSIPVYYTNNSGKKYKIRLIGSFSTVPQCVMNGEIKMSIDSATVYAPSSILKNIKEITKIGRASCRERV